MNKHTFRHRMLLYITVELTIMLIGWCLFHFD